MLTVTSSTTLLTLDNFLLLTLLSNLNFNLGFWDQILPCILPWIVQPSLDQAKPLTTFPL